MEHGARQYRVIERVAAPFVDAMLDHDFPGLTPARKSQVDDFVLRRMHGLPSFMYLGVTAIGALCWPIARAGGVGRRIIAWLADHPLPLVGEYVRLVRSLAYAYVWETWPSTLPDGRAA